MRGILIVSISLVLSVVLVACGDAIPHDQLVASQPAAMTDDTQDVQSTIGRDSSKRWHVSTAELPTAEALDVVYFFNSTIGWIGGRNKIFRTVDAGESWQKVSVEMPTGASVVDFSFVDEHHGWTLVQKRSSNASDHSDNHYWLMKTQDGGDSWVVQHEGNLAVATHVLFTDKDSGWLTGSTVAEQASSRFAPLVLYSRDGGEHWNDVSGKLTSVAGGETWITSLVLQGSNIVSVLSLRGAVFRTSNGGENWERVTILRDEPKQTCLCRLGQNAEGHYWIAGGAGGLEGTWGVVATRRDNLWLRYRLNNVYFADALMLSEQEGFACGSGRTQTKTAAKDDTKGVLLFTSDGGKTWNTVFQTLGSGTINAVVAVNANDVWAVGDRGLILHLRRRT